jgi:hypothetical protein
VRVQHSSALPVGRIPTNGALRSCRSCIASNPPVLERTLVPTLRNHKTGILIVLAAGQLAVLLTMPATSFALKLLGRAVTHGYAGYALLAPGLLALGVLFNKQARALDWRWLEWSPWGVKANVALAPMKLRFLWLPYALALGWCIPLLAFFEEEIFRNGTHTWLRGLLWGGLAFGLVHLVSCVTVRMSIYLTLVGVALVGIYIQGGFIAVFVTHASYNLLALTLVGIDQHLPRRLRTRLARVLPAQRRRHLSAPPTVAEPVMQGQPAFAGIDFSLEGESSAPIDGELLRQILPAHPRPTRQQSSPAHTEPSGYHPEAAAERRR